jgi:hypothetical protein
VYLHYKIINGGPFARASCAADVANVSANLTLIGYERKLSEVSTWGWYSDSLGAWDAQVPQATTAPLQLELLDRRSDGRWL